MVKVTITENQLAEHICDENHLQRCQATAIAASLATSALAAVID